jgi:CheY-like chemotaxis protein
VEVAGDGLEALEVIQRKGLDLFSLVLMDIQMPKMNVRAHQDKGMPIVQSGVSARSG